MIALEISGVLGLNRSPLVCCTTTKNGGRGATGLEKSQVHSGCVVQSSLIFRDRLSPSAIQYWEFLDLESQFTRWLDTHRRPYRRREPTMRVNKVGQKCGPRDDELDPVPTNDQYDLDDNFIDDSNLPETTDDGNYTDDDANSDSDVAESQHADCDDAPVEYAVDEDEDEESQDGSQGLVEDDDSATEDDDDDVIIATLRGPRVTMIPGSEGIREAKDLFNDEIDLPERSEVAPKQPSGSPDTPRTPSVAVRKRRRVQRSDSEHYDENPVAARNHRQKRRREVQVSGDESDASHARQAPGVAERLSQVILQTPPRPGRCGSRGGMRLRRSDAR